MISCSKESPVGANSEKSLDSDAGVALAKNSAQQGKIVFSSNRDGDLEVYIMNVDGSKQTRLTNNLFSDSGASWSSNGKGIAFYTDRDGNFEIYNMNADGSGATRLTNYLATDELPSWGKGRL